MSRLLFINPPVLAADGHQVCMYAEAVPFGLIQIATHFRERGDEVELVDMMGYLDGDFDSVLTPENLWGHKPVGDNRSSRRRAVYLYGRSLDWLDERLAAMPAPDEVFVTCAISFNYEVAHAVIERCRRHFPGARVRFGGPHPTTLPEHAATSGADEIFAGRFEPALEQFPDLDFLSRRPPIWLFRLVSGCKYNCSFCANATHGEPVAFQPRAVADEILRVHDRWGIRVFSNWDPNVMMEPAILEELLEILVAEGAPVSLKFEMGIQPDRLTPELARLMKRAGTIAMTIPFESVEPSMMRRFGKPYTAAHAARAVSLGRELGFETEHFHCTWVLGFRGESLNHIFGTYFAVLAAGGLPTPFPLTVVPGTREAERHAPQIEGKDLSELNGHLWPVLDAGQVELYDSILGIVSQPDPERAMRLAADLPREVRDEIESTLERAWPDNPGRAP